MLSVNNVSFLRSKKKILENLSFHVGQGECAVLAGPNGCGKSTTLSLVANVMNPHSGNITTSGKIGYIPQETALIEDATVLENLRFFAKLSRSDVPKKNPFSVDSMKNKLVAKLSGGMKKQVSIACALIGDPQILLLDEPCASLDVAFRDEMSYIVQKWKKEGKALIYVGHEPSEFYDFFDHIIFVGTKPKCYDRKDLNHCLSGSEQFTKFYMENIKSLS